MGEGDISDPLDFHWIPGSYASEFLRTPRPNTVTHHIFQKLESSFELESQSSGLHLSWFNLPLLGVDSQITDMLVDSHTHSLLTMEQML